MNKRIWTALRNFVHPGPTKKELVKTVSDQSYEICKLRSQLCRCNQVSIVEEKHLTSTIIGAGLEEVPSTVDHEKILDLLMDQILDTLRDTYERTARNNMRLTSSTDKDTLEAHTEITIYR